MKAVFVIYSPALETPVMGAVAKSGIKKYSKFPYLLGVGGHSDPHLDTSIWPGSNSALFIATDESTVAKLSGMLAQVKKDNMENGLKIFALGAEEVL